MKLVFVLLGSFVLMTSTLLGGCTSRTMVDTHTIHNREATRIWIVKRREGLTTKDEVVFCDVAMVQAGRDLCISWDGR